MASSQIPLVSVPFKRTDDVNWIDSLNRYIAQQYQDDPKKYAQETYTLNRLRQDMRGAGKDLTGRDLLYRYFGQLELLELRFPVDEKHIKILFTWYDAFSGKATSQHSLAYEKASVLFNIAATLSAIASAQNRAEADGRKRAFHFLQAAAGVFDYINDNFLHAPSADLSRETVKLLGELMLAQAHECFLENSIREKKKEGLIAKLASHAVWAYANLVDESAEVTATLEKSWIALFQVKHRYYQAIAQQFKALACEAAGQYGEQVARWTVAEQAGKEGAGRLCTSLIQQATASNHAHGTLPPDTGPVMQELCKALAATCTEKLAAATRDNDMIYHDQVPQASVLTPIDRLNAVKSVQIVDLYTPEEMTKVIGQDIFTRLIPLSVHERASMYSEEQAKLVRAEDEKCDDAKAELRSTMEYMKLPQALDKFKRPAATSDAIDMDPPTTVFQWADAVAEKEKTQSVRVLMDQLEQIKIKARHALDDVGIQLDQEMKECESKRVVYGDAWTQAPSGTLTQQFRQDARNHRQALDNGTQSDSHLYRQFDTIKKEVDQLRQGGGGARGSLERVFAERLTTALADDDASKAKTNSVGVDSLLDLSDDVPAAGSDAAGAASGESTKDKVKGIESLLDKLYRLEKDRAETLDDLKERTRQEDISQLLILNKKSGSEQQLFANELEKYRPHQQRIAGSIQQQQRLIQDLTAAFKVLMDGDDAQKLQLTWEKAENQKRKLVDQFKHAKDTYMETHDGLLKGIQYYQQLAGAVESLLTNVRSFSQERAKERDQLCKTLDSSNLQRDQALLKERLSMYTTSGSPSAPDVSQLTERAQQLTLQQPMATPTTAHAPPLPAPPIQQQQQQPMYHHQPMYQQPQQQPFQPPVAPSPNTPQQWQNPPIPPKQPLQQQQQQPPFQHQQHAYQQQPQTYQQQPYQQHQQQPYQPYPQQQPPQPQQQPMYTPTSYQTMPQQQPMHPQPMQPYQQPQNHQFMQSMAPPQQQQPFGHQQPPPPPPQQQSPYWNGSGSGSLMD
ncbi:BRO1-like domain-containing protein [Gongronella butleri]|nr:BRO1-like domain-containing protein [Gongronella butleri]